MSNVSIRGLSKRFGGKVPTTAIDDLTLEIRARRVPRPPRAERLRQDDDTPLHRRPRVGRRRQRSTFGDRTVFDAGRGIDVPPNKRNIGMVFQSYALWPHMTVRQNIGYPLRWRALSSARSASEWIEEVAALVACSGSRPNPGQLSGGQQQRVALSRGLVARPVSCSSTSRSAISTHGCATRCAARSTSSTSVCTSPASTSPTTRARRSALGDRLAIMRAGKIEQLGRPEDVFEEPATEYVAGFIGMENRLTLERQDGGWRHDSEPLKGELGFDDRAFDSLTARARPEDLQLSKPGTPVEPDTLSFSAIVVDSEFGGRSMDVLLTVAGTRLHSRMPAGERGDWIRSLNAGEQVNAYLPDHRPDVLRPGRCTHRRRTRRAEAREHRRCLRHRSPRSRSRPHAASRSAPGTSERGSRLIVFIGLLAYLILLPLVRIQVLAFSHGGRAYGEAFREPGIWKTVWQTVELALGSLAIALVLGTALAWAASTLSPRLRLLKILPILPIVVPAIASVLGWSFLFSPHPGYLNALLRHLPWWHHLYEGPGRHLHAAVDCDRHRSRSHLVHLSLRQRRIREHQRRAARGGAGVGVITGGRLLPRHASAAATRTDLRLRRGPPAGAGTVHGAADPRREQQHHRADHRDVPRDPADSRSIRRRRGARLAAAHLRGDHPPAEQDPARRPRTIRHTRRQVVPERAKDLQDRCRRARALRHRRDTAADHRPRARRPLAVLVGRAAPEPVHPERLRPDLPRRRDRDRHQDEPDRLGDRRRDHTPARLLRSDDPAPPRRVPVAASAARPDRRACR